MTTREQVVAVVAVVALAVSCFATGSSVGVSQVQPYLDQCRLREDALDERNADLRRLANEYRDRCVSADPKGCP